MTHQPLETIVRYLRRLALRDGESELTDAHLLERFIGQRDEAAFEILVWRHAALVLGVCRRILHHEQDAEDAFQATFLTFARKAGSISKHESVGSWLFKVAYRTALKCKTLASRRARREQPLTEMPATAEDKEVFWRDLSPVLDQAINRLPEKYRLPFLLCYLENKTLTEAAKELGCPRATVGTRLARARERLRRHLAGRGVTLSTATLTAMLSHLSASGAVPISLIRDTIKVALFVAAGQAATAVVSSGVAALTEGVMKTMLLSKFKIPTAVLATMMFIGLGVGLLAHSTDGFKQLTATGTETFHLDEREIQEFFTPDDGGFIRNWLILAPVPHAKNQSAAEALRQEQVPGEAKLQPRAGDRVKIDGQELTWKPFQAKTPLLKFETALGKQTKQSVGYAVCYLVAEQDMNDLMLVMAHRMDALKNDKDEQAKVYLNGKQVFQSGTGELPKDLRNSIPANKVSLKKGINLLVWKAVNEKEAWSGCLRFSDRDGVPITDVKVVIPGPAKAEQPKAESNDAANRVRSQDNLRRIGLALHKFHDTHKHFPTAAIHDKAGKPLLSWRVAILPFLGEEALYKEFKLDEPWDSDHNKKLLAKMPTVYAPPGIKTREPHTTFYQVFDGKGALFEGKRQITLADVKDGTSNTIMAIEAGEAVPWIRPQDLPFDLGKKLPKLGGIFPDGFHLLAADGAVHYVEKDFDQVKMHAAITRDGQELDAQLNNLKP